MKGNTLTNGASKTKRREHDFYPTPKEVTIVLMDFLISIGFRLQTVWEPACGDGAISKVIESYGIDVFSTELRIDNNYGAGGLDFLTHRNVGADAIITNPPFNISEQFIERAVEFSPISAMVLKSQYWHAKSRYNLFNKYPPAYILPLTWRPDFAQGTMGDSPTMEVLWTVWIKHDYETKYILLKRPEKTNQLALGIVADTGLVAKACAV